MPTLVLASGTPSFSALLEAASRLGVDIVVARESEPPPFGATVVLDLDAPHAARAADPVVRVRRIAATNAAPVVIGSRIALADVEPLFRAGARDVIPAPLHKRELVLRLGAVLHRKHRVACLGGGTGLFTVLSAMKDEPGLLLSSIVTMSDDGGSSGRLRTSFGVLPPGDVRRSLVALSNAPEVMSYVMQYRFQKGGDDLSGHSLGNLLLAALAERSGSMQHAVKSLGDVLNVQGHVMCVTEQPTTLCAEFEDGRVVRGESSIDRCVGRPHELRARRVWHEPAASTSVDVLATLFAADVIVLGPGDMITSVLAVLLIDGVADAVRRSPASRIYICNLMTKPGESHGFDVVDHVLAVNEALGGDVLDYVLVSSTAVEPGAVEAYAALHQHPVVMPDEARLASASRAQILQDDVGDRSTLVRHDPAKLRAAIVRLLDRRRPSSAPGAF